VVNVGVEEGLAGDGEAVIVGVGVWEEEGDEELEKAELKLGATLAVDCRTPPSPHPGVPVPGNEEGVLTIDTVPPPPTITPGEDDPPPRLGVKVEEVVYV
jgi:hypothetical protein